MGVTQPPAVLLNKKSGCDFYVTAKLFGVGFFAKMERLVASSLRQPSGTRTCQAFRASRQSAALPQPLIRGAYGVFGTISDETCDVNWRSEGITELHQNLDPHNFRAITTMRVE